MAVGNMVVLALTAFSASRGGPGGIQDHWISSSKILVLQLEEGWPQPEWKGQKKGLTFISKLSKFLISSVWGNHWNAPQLCFSEHHYDLKPHTGLAVWQMFFLLPLFTHTCRNPLSSSLLFDLALTEGLSEASAFGYLFYSLKWTLSSLKVKRRFRCISDEKFRADSASSS